MRAETAANAEVRNLSSRKLWEILNEIHARPAAASPVLAKQARDELRRRNQLSGQHGFCAPH